MNQVTKLLRSTIAGPLLALLLVVIIVSLTTDRFLHSQNLSNITLQVSSVALVAIGSTLVILTAGIDLSPGAIVALVTCVLAILVKNMGLPVGVGILLALGLGVVLGLVNGILSTYGRIPSFVATLATMSIYRGLAFYLTNGSPIFSVSPSLEPVFYGRFLGIPYPFYYVLAAYLLAAVFLRYTISGRSIYATGGNRSAARLSGIHVQRVQLLAFVLAGVTAAIAGILTTARLNSGSPNYGVGLELQAIAAAVIGGASLFGGYGNIVATLLGALTVAVVQNGLNLNAVPAAWQNITLGLILALAVGVDMWREDIGAAVSRLLPQAAGKRAGQRGEGGASPVEESASPLEEG